MNKLGHILYALSWVAYIAVSFFRFPYLNCHVSLISISLLAIGAWRYGTTIALLINLVAVPYHVFLFDFYGDILAPYHGKLFGLIAQLLTIFLIGHLRILNQKTRRLSIDLDKRVARRTNKLNRIITQLIEADESARRSLGQNIHDGLGQHLTGLMLYTSTLKSEFEKQGIPQRERMKKMASIAQNNLHLARKISRTLFPARIMESGLEAAFDELVSYFSETTSVKFHVQLNGIEHLPENLLIHLYRIAYECIPATLEIDTPSDMRFTLNPEKKRIRFKVEIENCQSPKTLKNDMSLNLIDYRLRMINGTMTTSIPFRNSLTLNCTIPNAPLSPEK